MRFLKVSLLLNYVILMGNGTKKLRFRNRGFATAVIHKRNYDVHEYALKYLIKTYYEKCNTRDWTKTYY